MARLEIADTITQDCARTTFREHPEVELYWFMHEPVSGKARVDYTVFGERLGSLAYDLVDGDLYRTVHKFADRALRYATLADQARNGLPSSIMKGKEEMGNSEEPGAVEALTSAIMGAVAGSLAAMGGALEDDSGKLKAFVSQQVSALAEIVGQPGYDMALSASKDIVALFAAKLVYGRAQELDARTTGVILGALDVAAKAVSALV